jgi:hypothetical protein
MNTTFQTLQQKRNGNSNDIEEQNEISKEALSEILGVNIFDKFF